MQSWVKYEVHRHRFERFKRQIIRLQSHFRRKKSINRVKRMKRNLRILQNAVYIFLIHRRNRLLCVIRIQKTLRGLFARRKLFALKFRKMWTKLTRLCAEKGNQLIRMRLVAEQRRKIRQAELEAAEHETRMQMERMERERIANKLEEELRRNSASITIQSLVRGFLQRRWYQKLLAINEVIDVPSPKIDATSPKIDLPTIPEEVCKLQRHLKCFTN